MRHGEGDKNRKSRWQRWIIGLLGVIAETEIPWTTNFLENFYCYDWTASPGKGTSAASRYEQD
jgi:hypothetical protein